MLDEKKMGCHVVHVMDRFGDYGLCGVMIYNENGPDLILDSFLLSCRVLGRGVEHKMLSWLGKRAKDKGRRLVSIPFVPTPKNVPAKEFLNSIRTGPVSEIGFDIEPDPEVDPDSGRYIENDGSYHYDFRASFLSSLVFDPPKTETSPLKISTSQAAGPEKQVQDNTGLMQKIANELNSLDAIQKAMEFQRADQKTLQPGVTHLSFQKQVEKQVQNGENQYQPQVQKIILDQLAKLMNIEAGAFDVDQPFLEYGVDSLILVDLIVCLNKEFHIVLPTTTLFDYITINDLAGYLCKDYFSRVEKKIQGQAGNSDKARGHLPDTDSKVAAGKDEIVNRSVVQGERIEHISKKIAVIGMSGRFPKAANVAQFWELLCKGKNGVQTIPEDRWAIKEFYDPDPKMPGKSYGKWGGFLDDIDQFDPLFFNISGREAELMDPQHRLFLEESWSALEDAGYAILKNSNQIHSNGANPNQLKSGRNWGVFAGSDRGDYQAVIKAAGRPEQGASFTGNHGSILAARIAYFLNLKGHAVTIDTACSSSLAAVSMACESLLKGDMDLALAGGVAIRNTPDFYVQCSKLGMLSKKGKCRVFDDKADGFVPGEAVGVVVLKRLEQALHDKDHIYGVIHGSAMNQDGKTNGITAPNSLSQTDLSLKVYQENNINPKDISYVEAHGTGTPLGDPVEVTALSRAFRQFTGKEHYCAIGSVKSNIGHCIHAAGICGLIKMLLCLDHKKMVPSIHFNRENRHIPFEGSPFFVSRKLCDWNPCKGKPRLGAVSAFGFSGTNVHMVVGEAPFQPEKRQKPLPCYLATVSAKNQKALEQLGQNLAQSLDEENHNLEDICYTLNVGRSHFEKRWALVVESVRELKINLNRLLQGEDVPSALSGSIQKGSSADDAIYKQALDGVIQDLRNRKFLDAKTFQQKLIIIGGLYVKGVLLDFEALFYKDRQPGRISLPTYPFTRNRYWVDPVNSLNERTVESSRTTSIIHPLLHQNRSDVKGLCFTSTFTGTEFFWSDHKVKGQKVFPGAATLEMARTAVEQVVRSNIEKKYGDRITIGLKNLVWIHPIAFNTINPEKNSRQHQGTTLYIRLQVRGNTGVGSHEILGEIQDEI
ncbi:MAG: hypothetical protein GY729_21245, partial [Desulfobacteraceae bacterium]|nr:hypothetical protein [Desulfobacteraceae bacterium]